MAMRSSGVAPPDRRETLTNMVANAGPSVDRRQNAAAPSAPAPAPSVEGKTGGTDSLTSKLRGAAAANAGTGAGSFVPVHEVVGEDFGKEYR